MAALDDFLAPGYRRHVSPSAPPLDLAGQKQRLAGLRAALPDITLTVEDRLAEGDRAAFRTTLRGTHQGMFQDSAPTGAVTVALLDLVRLENGKIVEQWGGPGFLEWLKQLGPVVSVKP